MSIAQDRRLPTAAPNPSEIAVVVDLSVVEVEALRDAAFTCTSADPRRHQAATRALDKLRAEAARCCPRPPLTF